MFLLLNRIHSLIARQHSRLRGLFSNIDEANLFQNNLIIHFTYHKCLTVYYDKVMRLLGIEFKFYTADFQSNHEQFEEAVSKNQRKKVLCLTNTGMVDINWKTLPEYRGSHFVRDPRDMIVSGYYYHLWTMEEWCTDTKFDWTRIIDHPFFSQYIESNKSKYPLNRSYKEYINTLDMEKGFILEMIFRGENFSQMENWNFNNPRILELKYEEIIGNEVECFRRLFEHYKFHPKLIDRGVEIAKKFRLEKNIKSNTGHVRNGKPRQWPKEFSPLVKDLFKKAYGNLLIQLGYEEDMKW